MKKKLSIVIPVYNVEKYLKKCLDSIVPQSEDLCEILLIDDGSTDLSPEICDEYERKYSNVTCYHKTNGGLSDARNFGIDKSSGEYIWFIDSDDFLEKNAIHQMLKLMENSVYDVIICKSKVIDEANNVYDECSYSIKEGSYSSNEYMKQLKNNPGGVIFCAQYHICKKELINKYKLYFYKGIIHEDELWTPQILINSQTIYYSDLNIYYHFMRKDSIMHASKLEKSGKCYLIVASELFEIFDELEGKDLDYLNDRCVNMYLQAVWKIPGSVKNTLKDRMRILKKSLYIKTKMKALLYFLSPKIYLMVHFIFNK